MIKACFYDPQVNRTYEELVRHYDTAVLPARPRKPRDKAKVEACVRIVERWLLGKLRHRRFYSLADVNDAIAELLAGLNERRVLRYVGRTRRQLFEELDQPRLQPLPAEPYVLTEWRVRKVGLDDHVEVEGHFYSVPYRHARTQVEVCFDLAHRGGVRLRRQDRGAPARQRRRQAHHLVGPHALQPSPLRRLDHRANPARGAHHRGLHRDALPDGPGGASPPRTGLPDVPGHSASGQAASRATRVEAACRRALEVGAKTYGSVKSILDNHLDGQPPTGARKIRRDGGQATYADAILDRLVHNAHRLELTGDSMRRTRRTPAA